MSSGFIKFLLILMAVIYFVSPIDALPDFLGPVGRIDDLIVLGLLIWQSSRQGKPTGTPREQSGNRDDTGRPGGSQHRDTPHEIFGLKTGATRDEIESRFKELIKQYHPDRVAHLGEDLRNLAHEKTIEIQRAYEFLMKANR
jgi:DnaJ like chaperone protein